MLRGNNARVTPMTPLSRKNLNVFGEQKEKRKYNFFAFLLNPD
jgi:hypothetical protein